ncbi:MAG: hypothetical protein KBT88_01200 [Gammaproteobacteria bacterium]|nr:hypothetical protein [Gammaproteobacteria bacterium]MBQ0838371.1 hypothetical protein [Gammaproteobacteria bacterium]
MSNRKFGRYRPLLALAFVGLLSPTVFALDYAVSGFIRQEMAYKINSDQNQNSAHGNPLNGKSYTNLVTEDFIACAAVDLLAGVGCLNGTLPKTLGRKDLDQEVDWNVNATRAEIDFSVYLTNNLKGFAKLRGYYQPDVFNDYGDNNLFSVDNHGNEATYLSVSDDDYMLDLPSLFLDYSNGPLWIRLGQQQIAWGEALFFRVADMANGLDLRRHLFFDFGSEEYADERLSAPGIRASYNLANNWELEVFAQMFQPSVIPNRGSPYSLLPYQFHLDLEEGYDRVQDNFNGGVRLRGQVGELGMQFFAISRHNPDPIIRLVPGGQVLEEGNLLTGPFGFSGETVDSQPFTRDTTGDYGFSSWRDWFAGTGLAGIDGLGILNTLIDEYGYIDDVFTVLSFAGFTDGFGDPYVSSLEDGKLIVDILVTGFEFPLQAYGEAVYASENIFGFGLNYIFYAEPDTLLDQLVVRFEASYTPDKKFTSPAVSANFIESDEWVSSVTVEKYHRFSDDFPATFFIFEWMHKSESDMMGRHLSGLGGDKNHLPGGGEQDRGWDGFVFALQQPFPNLTWRMDMSLLYDLNGGFFFQPAVRYKPNGDWTIEAFANIIDASNNGSIFAPLEYSDDFTMRLTYLF